jgi:DNA-binding CsgD family transcriptional regulator
MEQQIGTNGGKEYLHQLIQRQGELNQLIFSLLTDNELFEKELRYLKENFHERNIKLNIFEIKLCAYFRLGLNPKEISAIEEIDLNDVQLYNSMIRTKLNLNDKISLKQYLVYLK